jgi:hypothetical protein
MSTDYRLKKKVRLADLIDGRLEKSGVWEQLVPGSTKDDAKCLSDGNVHLWAYADRYGFVESLTRYGRSDNDSIVEAIERTFGTKIFSEFELEYWGYDTLLPTSEQAGAMKLHPASSHRKADTKVDFARESGKFGVEFQAFSREEPVR